MDISLLDNLFTLFMLILLQAVLGFDNLLYISLESKRAPVDRQAFVRKTGIGLAVALRIVLLILLVKIIHLFQDPFLSFDTPWIKGELTIHSLVVLLGGAFIVYTATKEVMHMMALEDAHAEEAKPRSVTSIITLIVLMNLVFSFDSILSAIALTEVLWVMVIAILTGGALMIWLSDHVSTFLEKNRMYEVLGLFILFVVGIMLITEGGHLAHLQIFDQRINAMTKTTFYFVIAVMVLTDVVQSRYRKKLQQQITRARHGAAQES